MGSGSKYLLVGLLFSFVFFACVQIFVFAAGVDVVSLVSPGNDSWTNSNNDTIQFIFNYIGNNSTASCEIFIAGIPNGTNATVLNNTNTTMYANSSIPEGSINWFVNCTNSTSANSSTYILNVDRTNPVVTLVSPVPSYNTSSSSINFQFNVTDTMDPILNCSLYVNSTLLSTNESVLNATLTTFSESGIASGMNQNWTVNCSDNASNSHQPSLRIFNRDTSPPVTTITNPANSTINVDTFTLSYSDVNCSVYSANGGTNVTNCSIVGNAWSGTLGGLSDGINNITVWANDSVGNINATVRYWTRDTDAPDITIDTPANQSYSQIFVWANVTLDQATDWCGYSMNGTANVSMSNDSITHYFANISAGEGQQNITFWCNDTLGNMNVTSVVLFRFDVTFPTDLSIVLPVNITYPSTSRTLNYTFTETNVDTCWYEYNSGNTTIGSCANTSFSALDNQQSTLILWINDTAGNTNSSSVTFTVDTDAPDITVNNPVNSTINSDAFNFTYTDVNCSVYSLNGGANVTNCSIAGSEWTGSFSISDGVHNVTVWANDSMGNTNSTVRYWIRDTAIAPPTINNPVNSTINSDAFNFTYSEVNCSVYSLDAGTNVTNCSVTGNEWMGTLTVGSDGNHNITVWVNDSAGNWNSSQRFWTRDTAPPNITIDSPDNQSYAQTWIWANVTLDQDGAWCGYSLNGTANVSMSNDTATHYYANVSAGEGQQNITFWCNDTTGNVNNSVTVLFRFDVTYPSDLSIVLPANITYGSTSRTLNYTYTETNVDTCWYEYNSSNTTLSGCSNTSFTALDNQQSTIILWINDTAGNTNSSSVTFTVDTDAPDITITNPANDTINSDAFAFSYTDVNCSVYSANGGANVTNCSIVGNAWSGTIGGLSDGVNNITIRANDSVGNINATVRYWTRDTNPPDITIDSPDNQSYAQLWVWGNVTLDQATDWCGYSLNGTANVSMSNDSTTHYYANVSAGEGQQNITFWCNDTTGNVNNSVTVLFRFDITYPTDLNIVLPTSTTYPSTSRTLNYTFTESNIDTCLYEYNSSNTTLSGCGNTTFAALDNQQSTLILWINDTAGNINYTSVTFTVDTDAPDITMNIPANGTTTNSDAFNITYSETVSWTAYSIDGTANVTNSSVSEWVGTFGGLSDGFHNITIWANDSMGWMNSTIKYWTMDTSVAAPTINNPTNTTVNSDAFNFTYTDVNCSVYSADGNTNVTNCSIVSNEWTGTLSGLSDGTHNITVWVNDSTGNWNYSQRFWTRDIDAPQLTFESPLNQSYSVNWAWFNVTSDQTVDWCGYSMNGTANVTMSNDSTTHFFAYVTGLSQGQHNITFWCNDTTGNMNNSEIRYFRIDTTFPTMSLILPGNTTYTSTSRTLNYTISETNIDTCWYEYNSTITTLGGCTNTSFTALNNQQSTLTLWINDTAGNTNSSSVTFTVDTDAPDITIELPLNQSYDQICVWANVSLDQNGAWCGYSLNETSNVTMTNDSKTHWYAMVCSLNEEQYNITFSCNDTAGNMNTTNVRYFRIDATFPTMNIITPGNTTYTSTSRRLNYTFTESNVDACWYEYNSANITLNGCTNTSFNALDNQQSTLILWINDTAGNTNSSSVTFTIDRDPPDITIDSPSNQSYSQLWVWANVTLDQATDWCGYSMNGTANVTMSNDSTTHYYANVSVVEGQNNLVFWCNDTTGNINRSYPDLYFKSDITYPTMSIILPDNTTYTSTSRTLNYTFTETNVDTCWYEYNSANTTLSGCGNTTFTALDEQQSTLVLWINDTTGHINSTSVTFSVDSTPPALAIITPANGTTKSDTFAFSYSGANCLVYSVNSGTNVTNCSITGNSWSGTLGGLSDGTQNITVWANDSAGNINVSIRYWTRDTDAPDLFNATNGTVGSTTATIVWNTTESSNSTVLYSTNQSNLNSTSGSATLVTEHSIGLTGLTINSTYYYNVSSCDQAGNCNTTGIYNFTTSSAVACVESWSCTEWVLSLGSMLTRTCTDVNSCGTTLNKPNESMRYIGGGGGAPSGTTESPPQVKHSWVKIAKGAEVNMSITKEGLDFSEIKITVKNEVKTVTITITKLGGKPAEVTHDFTGKKVYQYVTIEKTNIENEDIEKSTIKFRVPKIWLTQNSINKAKVILNRYGNGWIALATRMLSEDDENVYYEADTSGFSVFAVTGETINTCEPGEMRCSESVLEQCSEDGMLWESVSVCDYGCNQETNECKSRDNLCEPGVTRCYGNVLELCSSDGFEWMELEVCSYGCTMNEKCIKLEIIPGVELDYNIASGYVLITLTLVLLILILRPINKRKKIIHRLRKKKRKIKLPKIKRKKKR